MSFIKIKNLIRHAIVFIILIIIQIFSWLRRVNIRLRQSYDKGWKLISLFALGKEKNIAAL